MAKTTSQLIEEARLALCAIDLLPLVERQDMDSEAGLDVRTAEDMLFGSSGAERCLKSAVETQRKAEERNPEVP